MPHFDIGNLNKMLIGISCMNGIQKELLNSAWKKRFVGLNTTAVIVNVEASASEDEIINAIIIELLNRNISVLTMPIILAVFVDIREDAQVDFLRQTMNLDIRLNETIMANITNKLVFEHIGAYRLESLEKRSMLKEKISVTRQKNATVLLVGRFPLISEEETWKAEMALLDVLCRGDGNTTNALVPQNFGFLGYGNGQRARHQVLAEEKNRLLRRLEGTEENDFSSILEDFIRTKLTNRLKEDCEPIMGVSPIAPGMLEITGFFARRNARNGNDPAYNAAWEKTIDAAEETGKSIKSYAETLTDQLIDDAKKIFEDLLEDAGIGIPLLKERNRMVELIGTGNHSGNPKLELSGVLEEIDIHKKIYEYLLRVFDCVCNDSEAKIRKALLDVYEGISDEDWDTQIKAYRMELQSLEEQLQQLPDVDEFFRRVLDVNKRQAIFRKAFMPNFCGESVESFFLLHGDGLITERDIPNSLTCIHYKSELTGYENVEALSTFLYGNATRDFDRIVNDLLGLNR